MSRTPRSAFRAPRLNSTLLACLLLSCGSDKNGDASTDKSTTHVMEVCGGKLTCGTDCHKDGDCPSGQYCDDKGACYAECAGSVGCDGTCDLHGRCDGTRTVVVDTPSGDLGNDPLIVSDPNESTSTPTGMLADCATSKDSGELTPVSLYVMFDNSLSMKENARWDNATAAMNAFFQDPASAGLGIALRFFGDNPTPGCDAEACTNGTIAACATPEVALGQPTKDSGDPQETLLVNAVDAANPDFAGTPIFAALSGATQWGVARKMTNPDEQVVVLLVTDGIPQYQDCTEDIGEIAAVAADAYAQAGVLTYAIGLHGSSEAQMNQIAEAGHSGKGIFIGDANAEEDLLAALSTIRGQVASCDLLVPRPTGNATLDPSQVNVTLTLAGTESTLGQVENADACSDKGAWYYDDPTDPGHILLCPTACDAVNSDPTSEINVVLGCTAETKVFPPLKTR